MSRTKVAPAGPEPRISLQEAARRGGVHEDTVRRAIARGELTVHKIGRVIRLDPAEVNRWVGA